MGFICCLQLPPRIAAQFLLTSKFIRAENAPLGPVPLHASSGIEEKGNWSYGFSFKFGASVYLKGGCKWPRGEAHTS